MRKFLQFLKKYVRPHYKYNKRKEELKGEGERDKMHNFKENSEIGIKFTFKF